MSAPDHESKMSQVMHLMGPGGLFGSSALCGATAGEFSLWMSEVVADVTCHLCLDLGDHRYSK